MRCCSENFAYEGRSVGFSSFSCTRVVDSRQLLRELSHRSAPSDPPSVFNLENPVVAGLGLWIILTPGGFPGENVRGAQQGAQTHLGVGCFVGWKQLIRII